MSAWAGLLIDAETAKDPAVIAAAIHDVRYSLVAGIRAMGNAIASAVNSPVGIGEDDIADAGWFIANLADLVDRLNDEHEEATYQVAKRAGTENVVAHLASRTPAREAAQRASTLGRGKTAPTRIKGRAA